MSTAPAARTTRPRAARSRPRRSRARSSGRRERARRMKVKQVPGDFVVVERASLSPRDRGRWSVYLLRKRGIGTLEALRALRRAWKLPPRVVGFGGLKDRHAETVQWVTIENGPRTNLEEPAFRLTYEGKSDVPMSRTTLVGNRFEVRLRGLARGEAPEIASRF